MDPLELFRRYRPLLLKKRGQCFLTNKHIAERIVAAANLDPKSDVVVEIGTGLGTLTFLLVEVASQVISYEIDSRFLEILAPYESQYENLTLISHDILEVDLPPATKIVSNVPFNISGPLLFKLFKYKPTFSEAVLVFQKEFAHRLLASPGGKNYSRLSAWINLFADVEILFEVSRQNYFPVPRVDTTAVKLVVKDIQLPQTTREGFFELIRGVFPYKNKKLRNGLHYYYKTKARDDRGKIDEILEGFECTEPGSRYLGDKALQDELIKNLPPEFFLELCKYLAEKR